MDERRDRLEKLNRAYALVSEAERIFYSLKLNAAASGTMELGAALSLAKERLRLLAKKGS